MNEGMAQDQLVCGLPGESRALVPWEVMCEMMWRIVYGLHESFEVDTDEDLYATQRRQPVADVSDCCLETALVTYCIQNSTSCVQIAVTS